jgi:hypothetical protein
MTGVAGNISAFTRVFDALCPAMTRFLCVDSKRSESALKLVEIGNSRFRAG